MTHKMYVLKKGQNYKFSAYLKQSEIDCRCSNQICTTTFFSQRALDAFENTRFHFGRPVNISSGFRCIVHNKAVGGREHSDHTKGDAVDMFPSDLEDLTELYEVARNYFDYCYVDYKKGFVHGSKRT